MLDYYEDKPEKLYIWQSPRVGVRPHFHKHIEIVAVLGGGFDAILSSRRYHLRSGDLVIAYPNEVHEYIDTVPGDHIVLIFDPDVLPEYRPLIEGQRPERAVIAQNGRVIDEVIRLYEDYGNPDCAAYRDKMFRGHLLVLMGYLLRELTLHPQKTANLSATHLVLQYCQSNFRGNVSLDGLSRSLHLSKYYISRIFSNNLSTNLRRYINDLRISYADTLLLDTQMSVTAIAYESGFDNIRSFNRAFRRIHQISPLEFRAARGKNGGPAK